MLMVERGCKALQNGALSWEWRVLALCCLLALAIALPPRARTVSQREEGVTVPIVMYHSLLKDPARHGAYTVSPSVLESDVRYLLAHGYTPVWISDLIAYVHHGAPLPEKPVVITFDDGHLNNLTYALPILEKLGAKAVLSAVGAYADEAERQADPNPAYAYLTWADLQTLQKSGCFQILSHSYDLHGTGHRNGVSRMAGEVLAVYQGVVAGDTERMRQALHDRVGADTPAFTYPFGFVDEDGEQLLRRLGYLATLSCRETRNRITRNPECLYALGRFNRPAYMSTAAFMKRLLGK